MSEQQTDLLDIKIGLEAIEQRIEGELELKLAEHHQEMMEVVATAAGYVQRAVYTSAFVTLAVFILLIAIHKEWV